MKLSLDQKLPIGKVQMPIVTVEGNNGRDYTFILNGDIDNLKLGEKYKVESQGWEGILINIGVAPLAAVTRHKVTKLARVCTNCGKVHDMSETDDVPDAIRRILSKSLGFV